jgi:N-acetylmuramoyl-L-alanine amidase
MRTGRQFVMGLLVLLLSSQGLAAKLTQLVVSANNSLVLEIDHNVDFRWFLLSHPNRLIVDIQDTQLQTSLQHIDFSSTPIATVRAGLQKSHALRLVFDLTRPQKPLVTSELAASGTKRIFINFSSTATVPVVTQTTVKNLKPIMSVTHQDRRNIVVVIDPGHGGKDPGATGRQGTHEKDVVLAISKYLAELLNNTPGYNAVLTRKGDYFIELRGRMKLARKDKADMFIAIHADAYINALARGSSVFAISAHGASSEAARWLAERENYSELGGVNLNQLNDKNNLLRSVLIDLSQNATITSSLQLGNAVLRALGQVNRLHHNKVEQAPFMVLKSPDIPSILVETGFLSNAIEEQNLRSPYYQQKIARALYQGVMDYFAQNLPEGTMLAQSAKPMRYIVTRGDTVASVAQHYRTTVAALRRVNNLRSDSLSFGQELLIPTGNNA